VPQALEIGNTEVQIAATNHASLLPQIAVYRYWKTNFRVIKEYPKKDA
jgi:hypothetical protein